MIPLTKRGKGEQSAEKKETRHQVYDWWPIISFISTFPLLGVNRINATVDIAQEHNHVQDNSKDRKITLYEQTDGNDDDESFILRSAATKKPESVVNGLK